MRSFDNSGGWPPEAIFCASRAHGFGYGMYILKHGIKKNPQKRWALPDRIFFGHGACHILAGTFLELGPLEGFYAERIIPDEDFSGNHIYVTNGTVAFDYHGYSDRRRLLEHHRKGWTSKNDGWAARSRESISIYWIQPS
ncbi:hypothetical protein MESS2_1500015 [Mesorhizobium metallidurans STM 2683]|uniref:Uncharacterized protein n=1 Tax=Mesorhizobium metallidurans STM 2683 TaxID=1297569 RepID=M5ELW4_9HYPH|nr:hypothetical protein MESS2_1500015 [Mesorhizobium metallidurans STM 2683]